MVFSIFISMVLVPQLLPSPLHAGFDKSAREWCLGEASSVENPEKARTAVKRMIEGVPISELANCDESALFVHSFPLNTLATKARAGVKLSKLRFTLMFTVFADGAKCKSLLIGKAERPRCSRGENRAAWNALCERVTYEHNKSSAWMTKEIFVRYLDDLGAPSLVLRSLKQLLMLLSRARHNSARSHHTFSGQRFRPPSHRGGNRAGSTCNLEISTAEYDCGLSTL